MKITKKIVSYSVAKPSETNAEAQSGSDNAPKAEGAIADVIQMHEKLERPNKLVGSTYKLKTPEHVSAHAMYITINDIVLNEGTENELRRPFEVFINSKNLEHYQWIVALTLIMSAVFRKGGDITFLVDELRSVFDPRGGYWNKGKYMPSIIAEIGEVIERHLIDIGMLKGPELSEEKAKLIEDKKAELRTKSENSSANLTTANTDEPWMDTATLCAKCSTKAVILMDGCQTCMSCGDSKCS